MTHKRKGARIPPGSVGFQFDLFASPEADVPEEPNVEQLAEEPFGKTLAEAGGTIAESSEGETRDDDRESREVLELTPFQAGQLSTRSPYAPEVIEKARELFRRGMSYKSAAYALGIPVYTAREWMHRYRNGTFDVRTDRSKGRYSEKTREEVVRLRTELGMSYNRIVKETGISRATVRSWLGSVGDEDREVEQFPEIVKDAK